MRNTDESLLQEAERQFADFLNVIATEEGVTISTRRLARFEPVAFHPHVISLIENIAQEFSPAVKKLPSGAGHDAQMLARVCPTAMIFTPSIKGISHNPAELTSDADLIAGANVLLQTMLQLAETKEFS
jgi:N-carbamoyl-L-amino-acid hydrolase